MYGWMSYQKTDKHMGFLVAFSSCTGSSTQSLIPMYHPNSSSCSALNILFNPNNDLE